MGRHADLADDPSALWIKLEKIRVGRKVDVARLGADIDLAGQRNRNGKELSAELLLAQIFPGLIEPLNAAVLAIGDEKRSIWRDRDGMHIHELPGPGAAFTPFLQLLAVGVVFDDTAVAVA